jgi:hypothetical protein
MGDGGLFDVYEVRETDGSWWVVGWDPELGSFFAQHLVRSEFGREERVLEDLGRLAEEIPTVDVLSEVIGRDLPGPVVAALLDDAAALGRRDVVADLPWELRYASRLHTDGALRYEEGWSPSMARIAQLYRDRGVQRLDALPAHPVVEAIGWLWEAAGSPSPDATGFAVRLGLEVSTAEALMSGEVRTLDGPGIGQVCEALRCSPYDLWGVDLAQAALHLYPPEHWPRQIEPLDALRTAPATPGEAQLRLWQFVEEQALRELRHDPVAPPRDQWLAGSWSVTAYRRVGLLERTLEGRVRRLEDGDLPADVTADYHLVFQAVGDPLQVADLQRGEPLSVAPATAGWDVDPMLTAVADRLRRPMTSPKASLDPQEAVELVRFTPPSSTEVWLGWVPEGAVWELVHDPRALYPGAPGDVVDPGGCVDPRPFASFDDPQDGVGRLGDLDDGIDICG